MPDIGENGTLGNAIAAQAVGDEAPRFVLQSSQEPSEETLGRRSVAALLHQDVQHNPMLVDGSPQIVQHAPDTDEHLIEVPRVPGLRTSSA
jgi:hypothetical protein